MRRLVRAAYNAGARFVYPVFGVTLRQNQRAYFLTGWTSCSWRRAAGAVCAAVRHSMNAAARGRGAAGVYGECRATGLLYGMQDIVAAYRQGYGSGQLSFL
ncbi:MAG: hypothetical protein ACLRZH_01770 [Ruthenibacterium lactatiformans]